MWASASDDRTVRVWGMLPAAASGEGEGEGGGAARGRRGPRLRPIDRAMRD